MKKIKGIFAWDSNSLKRAFLSARIKEPCLAYEFPLEAKAVDVPNDNLIPGHLFFKSGESIEKESDLMPDMSLGEKKLDKKEVQHILSSSWIFYNLSSGEVTDYGIIWFKTLFNDQEVFLIDDLFFENSICASHPDGTESILSGIPFCEKCPLDYTNDSGNYDLNKIAKWPIYFINAHGEVEA